MDPLTQGLLGAATAQVGFRQKLGPGATLAAGITAMLADLDICVVPVLNLFGAKIDAFRQMTFHRSLSHSLFMVPVIALLVALPWWWRRRKRCSRIRQDNAPIIDKASHPEAVLRPDTDNHTVVVRGPEFLLMYACVLVAALSHPLLDWCTSYGIQWFAPFSETRYALDAVSVIDFIYTSILVGTLLVCWWIRRHKADPRRATLVVGCAGLLLSTAYLACGLFMHNLAIEKATQYANKEKPGAKIVSANAYPYFGTIFLWRTTVETPDDWLVMRIRPLRDNETGYIRSDSARKYNHALIARAEKLPQIKILKQMSLGQLRSEYKHEQGQHHVIFHDMRYSQRCDSIESIWPVRVTFDNTGKVIEIKKTNPLDKNSPWESLKGIWKEMTL